MARNYFLAGSIALICLALISAGCTVSEHEQYSTITIKDKFFVHVLNPFAPEDPRLGTWDYYVISESGETSRVSEDVYSSVFKNNTYTLEWGDIGYCYNCNSGGRYGYSDIITRSGS